MSRAQEIRNYIVANPGRTASEIAKAIGWNAQRVSAAVWAELRKPVPGLHRKVKRYSPSNTPVYSYYAGLGEMVDTTSPSKVPAVLTEKHVVPAEKSVVLKQRPMGDLDKMAATFADTFARAMANHVAGLFQQHLTASLQGMMPSVIPEAPAPLSLTELTERMTQAAPAKVRKPKVLVAGLLPMQAGIISKDFADVFDLRFFTVDESLQQLKNMAANVDHVFTFTSKVNHAVESVIVGQGHKVHRCSGGMTMLKDQLLKLYVGEPVNGQ